MPITGNLVMVSKHLACRLGPILGAITEKELDIFFIALSDYHKKQKDYQAFNRNLSIDCQNTWTDVFNATSIFQFFPEKAIPFAGKKRIAFDKKVNLFANMFLENYYNNFDDTPAVLGREFEKFSERRKVNGVDLEPEADYEFRIIRNLIKLMEQAKVEAITKLGGY
jgi:hypothetical protein